MGSLRRQSRFGAGQPRGAAGMRARKSSGPMNAAQLQRQWDLLTLIEKKGGFDHATAYLALRGHFDETEKVAFWLRNELAKLRDDKRTIVSRVEIAEIAMTMLENIAGGFTGRSEERRVGKGCRG